MKYKQMFLTWLRASLASTGALYMAGVTAPKELACAAIAGFVGPVLKWLDTSAPEFGRTK